MSRFIEVFHKYHEDITMQHFLDMLEEMRKKLDAEQAFGTVKFPYFIEKKAPVSGSAGIMEYTCSYEASVSPSERNFYITIEDFNIENSIKNQDLNSKLNINTFQVISNFIRFIGNSI